jgi:hypothetical protein
MRLHAKIAAPLVTAGIAAVPATARSPGIIAYSSLTIGPGYDLSFTWQVNDAGPSATFPRAPGMAGGNPTDHFGSQTVSGWSVLASEKIIQPIQPPGNLMWTATSAPPNQFQFQLETLLGPTTPVGSTTGGPMTDFDPNQRYIWPAIAWQGTYTGPTDDATLNADTVFDTTGFGNAFSGTFSLDYNGNSIVLGEVTFVGSLDLVYTPVPEPGTLGLVGVAGLVGVWRNRRRCR